MKSFHVDNETVLALIELYEKEVWPRGPRLATIGSLRDEFSEATQTEPWDQVQDESGAMLPDYGDAYQ